MSRRVTRARLLAAACLLLASTGGIVSADAATSGSSSAVTVSRTVTRTFIDGGKSTVVDSRAVSLTVHRTTELRSLQLIDVSWKGAHPTGALVPDQNSDRAMNEEYPMVLLECRGTAATVSPETCWTQYGDERFTSGSDDPPWPAWRADSAATPAQRAAVVGAPTSASAREACAASLAGTTVQRWLSFRGADGTVYPGGPAGCAGQPPEAAPADVGSQLALPSNETFGVTDRTGAGSASFDVFTAEDHASLGCSQTVACSLVAVPVMGLSCDPDGTLLPAADRPDSDGADVARARCEAGPRFDAGEALPTGKAGEPAVSGLLWWSPSNWANRLSVPLTFAPSDNICSVNGSGTPLDIYGSELMIQATTQWGPHFCLNKSLFTVTHVQTPEPQARSLLATNNIEAAFTSDPPDAGNPYPTPTVNAPTAVTGFGIAYEMDDGNGQQVHTLRLDARLLAKLLTESYPAISAVRQGHPGMQNNPLNITYDPEFQALNPGVAQNPAVGAATLAAVSSDSDVMYALTSYINADPAARAFLDGTPDPWGMQVNPAYLKVALPVNNWPLLDGYEPKSIYQEGINTCLYLNPVPYLPLVAAPVSRLSTIAFNMQFALSASQTVCTLPSATYGSNQGAKMTPVGRQAAGSHALLGLVSLGDAERYGLATASLASYTDPSAPAQFTDTTGRTFVAPTDASLAAAASLLQPDAATGTWPVPYATLRTAAAKDAYPGTMVVYTAVPTSGLPAKDAARYATFLRFVAGPGQQQGTTESRLPFGYVPMTAAQGLGSLAAYTECAAGAVEAQKGTVPAPTKPCPTGPGTTGGHSGGTSTGGTPGSTGGSTTGSGGSLGTGTTGTGGSLGGTTGTTGATGSHGRTVTLPVIRRGGASSAVPGNPRLASVKTPGASSSLGGGALPALLILGIAALIAGVLVRTGARR